MRRIGVLMGYDENDPEAKGWLSGFTQGLAELGWTEGRNMRMGVRWAESNVDRTRMFAKELVDLQPDVILANTTLVTAALQRETRTIPIVFVGVRDPVASRIVPRLDRPNGNTTGLATFEGSLGGKWLELLWEIAPWLKRAAIMFNPDAAPISTFMPSLETGAGSLKVASITAPVRSDVEIETAINTLGREPGGGLIITSDSFMGTHRASIISAAARNNVPAVYAYSYYTRDGGLLSYGPDLENDYSRAATYVDLILRGAKPAELPVQLPTKYELVVNLKTAKALGLTVPQSILLRADEIIE
jgi:putative ABC transport system substrate-binding protein